MSLISSFTGICKNLVGISLWRTNSNIFLEKGFLHSAFTFGNESQIARSNINASEVPAGALVNFIRKGLQYCEIEAHVAEVREYLLFKLFLSSDTLPPRMAQR